jgi:hypothetical protein
MPSEIVAAIAGRPSTVAGILISVLGRSMRSQSRLARSTVPSVSLARSGSTSIDTRPSTRFVASKTGRMMSQPFWTSVVVSSNTVVLRSAPDALSVLTWSA